MEEGEDDSAVSFVPSLAVVVSAVDMGSEEKDIVLAPTPKEAGEKERLPCSETTRRKRLAAIFIIQ